MCKRIKKSARHGCNRINNPKPFELRALVEKKAMLVRRCSLRPDQPMEPPEAGTVPTAGYSAERVHSSQLKVGSVVGSRGVGVKPRSGEGTFVPWSRRRRKARPTVASSYLDTNGITRPCRERHSWRTV